MIWVFLLLYVNKKNRERQILYKFVFYFIICEQLEF